ncbi:MAG: hypothetical protein CVU00_13595 [Bacteroidetes bacterium HGW-Bacteroidetes-17]|jgi:hypothetical protein|nr:MAG: hypothetical protein CVU00_13595 [Bacteroidetes bacterium HGW-Bacteroidetes-17]
MQIRKSGSNKLLILFLIIALGLGLSCSEKYWPELNSAYEHLLVIDGKITNEPGPYTINLSTSSSIEQNSFNPLSNAHVVISDDFGNSELLLETSSGKYQTAINGIHGIIGRKYKISIIVNGKSYESTFEELKNPVKVEKLNAEWVKHTGASNEEDEYGYQFYLSTETANETVSYYYWELTETYQYTSYYFAHSIYWGKNLPGKNGFEFFTHVDTLLNCWKTKQIDERFTYTTKNLKIPKLNRFIINFVPNSEKLNYKYALQVKQYTISENAYVFLNSLQKQNDIENSLYTTQPYQILGNVQNVDDLEEPVLGYFLTAGVIESKPLIVKRPIGFNVPSDWGECSVLTADNLFNVMERVQALPSRYWPVVLAVDPNPQNTNPILVDAECVDCRVKGGVPVRPAFWDDNSLLNTPDGKIK